MNQLNVFVFVVGFSIAFEPVLCLGSLKKFTHLDLGKQDAFGNKSRKYFGFNGTEGNGKFTEDRNDSQAAKEGTVYLPFDVNRRNDNLTSPEITIKKRPIFPDVSTDKRNFTTVKRRNSHMQRRDGLNTTGYVKHGRREERVPSSHTRKTNKGRATEHGKNASITLTPAYASARSNFSENRFIVSGFKPSYKISKKDTNGTYRSLDLVLKVIKGKTSFIKPALPERRNMTCCAKKVNETFPAVNLTLTSENVSRAFGKVPVQVKTLQPIQVMVVKPPINFTEIIHKTVSIDMVFRPWNMLKPVPIKCPRSKPVFDQKTKTCKPTTSAPESKVSIAIPITGGNETDLNDSRKVFKECTALHKFEKDEYAVLGNDDPAVYIKKTGEVLQKQEYFRNETSANDSQAIFVCRLPQISNCSGVYIQINEGEFRVLMNKSIFVNASKQVYDWSEYTWINKSVLVCENFTNTYHNDDPVLTTITIVCMSLSIIGLVFVLVTYSLFSELRTPPGINLMNLSVSILLAQLLWLLGSGQTDTPMACTVIAVILHYLFLVSFVWTSIIAFDTWRAFSAKGRRPLADSRSERMKHCLRHMAVGWLPAVIYVAVCITLDEMNIAAIGYGSVYGCWIMHYHAKLYFFGAPVLALILFNLVFYSMTIQVIRKTLSQTKIIDKEHKRDFWVYVRVGVLMGFTWIFGFAAPFRWQFLWYPFVVLNSLQGLYIALAFGVNKRARRLYIGLARRKKETKEKGVSNYERSTKQSAVALELQGVTPTLV